MATRAPGRGPWTLTLPAGLMERLHAHLFPGDGDEHGAVLAAGVTQTERGSRLLARDLLLARDGVDYVPGQRGYRMLTAEFVRDAVLYCRDQCLSYLAVHCHGGIDRVGFSGDDLASHERGYPALLDIIGGPPVGALVFAQDAVAGDIWLPGGAGRVPLTSARVVDRRTHWLYPAPPPRPPRRDATYDRQARLLGDHGEAMLRALKVGVIGAGGVGSLVVEYLARLGVDHIVVADPQRIEITNLSRVVGSTRRDALAWLADEGKPGWLRGLAMRQAARKVTIAARLARSANQKGRVEAIPGDIVDETVARRFTDCDYLFLAADSMQARLVFNALVHQFLIPGMQLGTKVPVDPDSGAVGDVFTVTRPVAPEAGCLWCNGLISASGLQDEAMSDEERRAQRYVDEPEVIAPSVITLNAIAAALGTTDFLFGVTGLLSPDAAHEYLRVLPRHGDVHFDIPRKDADCIECGAGTASRRGRGDAWPLPTRSSRIRR